MMDNCFQIRQIKRAAQRAYEKQSRHKEDIQLRTKRLILKLAEAAKKLSENGWGWTEETYFDVFSRLNTTLECYSSIPDDHAQIFTAIENPTSPNKQARISSIYWLLTGNKSKEENKFETIAQLREKFIDRFDEVVKEMQKLSNTVIKLWKIYDPSSLKFTLGANLKRMDTILDLAKQYENGRVQRRIWAEKMQSRNMKHFFDLDFFEGWYNPILKQLDENLVHKIAELEDKELPELHSSIKDGQGLSMISLVFFGDATPEHTEQFKTFIDDITNCTVTDLKNESAVLLNAFKKYMHEFQSAYNNLFKKELPAYLENFEFGAKFVEENFAMVNVFLRRMNVETWRQESTYSIWSLACDVGGALGLFLGASLLTIIELIYLCLQYGACDNLLWCRHDNFCKILRSLKTHPADWSQRVASSELTSDEIRFRELSNQDGDHQSAGRSLKGSRKIDNHLSEDGTATNIDSLKSSMSVASKQTQSYHSVSIDNPENEPFLTNGNDDWDGKSVTHRSTTIDDDSSNSFSDSIKPLFRSDRERQTFI